MDAQTDAQLLRAYAEHRADAAFAELVRRHIDLVHSAARRMVGDPHLAEDVTQATFLALAKNAAQLTERSVLAGWLHRTAQNIAAQTVRTDVRRRAREQEAAAMNELLADSSGAGVPPAWSEIAPHLDAALGELTEPERDAVLLRYFQRQSAREMAEQLGISDEAAQKRVSRAVDRLREFFAKRGVTVGASGLGVVISANAVQAAPVGLALTVSTAAALTGTALVTTATVTATKAIAMTAIQKTAIAVTIASAVTIPLLLQNREVGRLRGEVAALRSEKESLLVRGQNESFAPAEAGGNAAAAKVEGSTPSYLPPAEVVAKIAALLSERKPMDKARMEALANLMMQISPDQMDQAMLAARQLTDYQIRNDISWTLFRNWSEKNPRAALAFAAVEFQGQEKSGAIRDALQLWAVRDPDAAFAAWSEQAADPAKRLVWGGDQQEVVKALFEGMALQDFQKAVERLKGLAWDLSASALKGIGRTAGKTETGRELFLEQLKRVGDQPVGYEAMSDFMFNWSQDDLPSAKTWIENQPVGKQRDYALRQVGLNYVQRDPKAAADWWLAQTAPAERSQTLHSIVQTWAHLDIKSAGEWLNLQGNGEELDSGRSAFANVAVEHDPATAMKWAESISNPDSRNSVLLQTWRKWRRSDSAAADQFLNQCSWPAELVRQVRAEGSGR